MVQLENHNALTATEYKNKNINQHFISFIYLEAMNECDKKIFLLLFYSFRLFVPQLTNNKAVQQTVLQTNIWHYDQTHIQPFKA